MSEPIKAGDLVQIVRPTRCGCLNSLGSIFVTGKVEKSPVWGRCIHCKSPTFEIGTVIANDAFDDTWIEVRRLKRIPPLDELESAKQKEDIREPA